MGARVQAGKCMGKNKPFAFPSRKAPARARRRTKVRRQSECKLDADGEVKGLFFLDDVSGLWGPFEELNEIVRACSKDTGLYRPDSIRR